MSGVVVSEILAGLRHYYGLDDPIYVQYAKWLFRVLQGDLGRSLAGTAVAASSGSGLA